MGQVARQSSGLTPALCHLSHPISCIPTACPYPKSSACPMPAPWCLYPLQPVPPYLYPFYLLPLLAPCCHFPDSWPNAHKVGPPDNCFSLQCLYPWVPAAIPLPPPTNCLIPAPPSTFCHLPSLALAAAGLYCGQRQEAWSTCFIQAQSSHVALVAVEAASALALEPKQELQHLLLWPSQWGRGSMCSLLPALARVRPRQSCKGKVSGRPQRVCIICVLRIFRKLSGEEYEVQHHKTASLMHWKLYKNQGIQIGGGVAVQVR